jgi:hypothetical protein
MYPTRMILSSRYAASRCSSALLARFAGCSSACGSSATPRRYGCPLRHACGPDESPLVPTKHLDPAAGVVGGFDVGANAKDGLRHGAAQLCDQFLGRVLVIAEAPAERPGQPALVARRVGALVQEGRKEPLSRREVLRRRQLNAVSRRRVESSRAAAVESRSEPEPLDDGSDCA